MRNRVVLLVIGALLTGAVQLNGQGSASASSGKPYVPGAQKYSAVPHRNLDTSWSRPKAPPARVFRRGSLPKIWSAVQTASGARNSAPRTVAQSDTLTGRPLASLSRGRKGGILHGEYTLSLAPQTVTKALNAPGLVFTVSASPGSSRNARFTVDYRDLIANQGVDWTSRLQLATLPACALTTPERPACRRATPLNSVNDPSKSTVSATLPNIPDEDSPGGAGRRSAYSQATAAVVTATPGPGGSQGTYLASDLKPSGSWSQGGASGTFNWAYPFDVTPSATGLDVTPGLELAYNSGSVDGLNAESNPQSTWVGTGFSYQPGYVERTFRTCNEANISSTDKGLCWAGDILTISMPGGSTEQLVVDSSTGAIRPEGDHGERVERLMGASNGSINGEFWRITTTDGTMYTFGQNILPGGTTSTATHSAWNVPVYGGTSADGCAAKRCVRTWRWNLDMVEDSHRNVAAYYYKNETNYFVPSGTSTRTVYDRGGYLTRIDYGMTKNASSSIYGVANPPDRISFAVTERCNPTGTITCTDAQFVIANRQNWPDVPIDQSCAATGTCNINWPTFWTRKKLSTITTSYFSGTGTTYTAVDNYALAYRWSGGTSTASLDLASITRTATASGNTITLPPVSFLYATLDSRVKGYKGLPDMGYDRLTQIIAETGAKTQVTYSSMNPTYNSASAPFCTQSAVPADPANNTMECFPVNWVQPFQTTPTLDYFHKYVVVAVDEYDPNGLSAARHTTYNYAGPGWHFDDNEVVKPSERTYGQWRGYRTVETAAGDTDYLSANGTNDSTTRTRATYYLGMHGDRLPNGATRSVTFTDSRSGVLTDLDPFAGMLAESQSFDGSTEVSDSRITPTVLANTATRARTNMPDLRASVVDTTMEIDTTDENGAGSTDLVTNTITEYAPASQNETYLQRVDTQTISATGGTGAATGTCTKTTYADNASTWVRNAESEVSTYSTACPADGSTGLLARSRTYYDSKAAIGGTNVTAGDVTKTETATDVTGGVVRYATSTSTFDSFGRVKSQTTYPDGISSPSTARTISSAYTTNAGGQLTGLTNTLPALAGVAGPVTTTQTFDPARGVLLRSTDIAGRIVSASIDGLGRYTGVWKPGRVQGTDTASVTYAYQYGTGVQLAVTTKTLVDVGNGATPSYDTTIKILDAQGVLRQTQSDSPTGGRVITDSFVDSHGWTVATNDRWYTSGAPSTTVVTTASANVDARTTTQYDRVGRPVTVQHWKGADSQPVDSSTTIYDGDRTTVLPPPGGVASTSLLNGLGQVTESRQYTVPVTSATFSTAAYNMTTYSLNADDTVASMTTAAGTSKAATWTNTYDLLGRRVVLEDPDNGIAKFTYDDSDEVTSVVDATQRKTSTTYDAWSRPTARYVGSPSTGTKVASWSYDTLVKGALTAASVYVTDPSSGSTQTFTSSIAGYTPTGLPTGTDLTLSIPGLLPKYSTRSSYTATGLTASTTYAATFDSTIGQGNSAEKVTYWYDRLGNQNGLTGTNGYVTGATYTPYREASQYVLGVNDSTTAVTYTRDPNHRWITNTQLTGQIAQPQVENVAAFYDAVGNLTKSISTHGGPGAPTETVCYRYDSLQQLTAAWSATDSCASNPQTGNIGGPEPFWESWTYDAAGSRDSQVVHALPGRSASDATTIYTNGVAGHIHALASAATTGGSNPADTGVISNSTPTLSATYTATGATDTTTTPAGVTRFGYRNDGSLATITPPDGSKSEYLDNADGQHLVRIDTRNGTTTTTLYLPGQQVSIAASGATKTLTTTRYYTLASGQQIAVRKNNSNPLFTLSDPHGTTQLTYDPFSSPTNPPVSRRAFDPYGNELGSSGQSAAWIDDRAFLNQPKNPVVNLVDTGVREYNPTTGRFTSVDPQLDLSSALQANGYNYANNNPVRYSDPSGTAPACVREGTCTFKPNPLGGSPVVTGTRQGRSDNSGSTVTTSVSTPGSRAVDKILENIAVHDFYASGKDADEGFVQQMVAEDEKNRKSPEKLFNLRNGYACLNQMPSCLPRDDVIEVAKGWANGSNDGAILALKQAALYLAGGVAGKLASVAFLRLANISFLSTSTADLLQRIATQANAKIGTRYGGKGPVFGTKVHTEFASALNLLGRKDLATEVSYLKGQVVPYGTKGAVRLDVVEGNTMAPKAIYDLKTGTASLSTARIEQIRSQLPVGYQNIPISEVRP